MITVEPFLHNQHQIKYLGRRVGYCWLKSQETAVTFLVDDQCLLTDDEKRSVVLFIRQKYNKPIMRNGQIDKYITEGKT